MTKYNLQPLFPPQEPNFSADALAAAQGVLDERSREILEHDRARLSQTTGMVAYELGQNLQLDPTVTAEIQAAAAARFSDVSPSYHDYLNHLLGNVVTVLADQPVLDGAVTIKTNLVPHNYNLAQEACDLPIGGGIDLSYIESIVELDEPAYEYLEVEQPRETIDEVDMIALPEGVKLFRHRAPTSSMHKFLTGALEGSEVSVDGIDGRAASLLTWEMLEFYSGQYIARVNDDFKAEHRDRVEQIVGLYGPARSMTDIAEATPVSLSAVSTTFKNMRRVIAERLDPEQASHFVHRAKVTAQNVDPDILFTDTPRTYSPRSSQIEHDDLPAYQDVNLDDSSRVQADNNVFQPDGQWHYPGNGQMESVSKL